MSKPMPWTAKILDVLADLEPHTIDELVDVAGPLVPPGRAARQAEKGRRNTSTAATRVRPADELAVGRRALIVVSLRVLRRTGRLDVEPDGRVRLADRAAVLERALRGLVDATGRLTATDGSSDALFGVLDMRTRACAVLGIEP